jgi:transposase-like protein
VLNHLRVEQVLQEFVARHILWMLFLFHGDAMNTPNLNLIELTEQFGTDGKCRKALEQLRWKDGVKCPRCDASATPIANRFQYDCDSCHYQFSVTAGTIFHDSHLSLWKWFVATALLCEAKKGMSACQVQRTIGVSYKTAWYLCHRIRAAMVETNKPKLDGKVEMDETFIGGHTLGRHRRLVNKEIVVGIRQRNGELRLFHSEDVKAKTLAKYIRENVSDDAEVIFTDDYPSYPSAINRARMEPTKHKAINHSKRIYVIGDTHTNTIENAFSLFKRGVRGTWHHISAKHLAAYLEEMSFRFNNRKNPYLFRDTILKLIASSNLEYKNLTARVQSAA